MKRFKVKTGNPHATDQTLQALGACALEQDSNNGYLKIDDCYILRIFSNEGYIKFAISSQGYCELVEEID